MRRILSLLLILAMPAWAQSGRFGSAGTPNVGPPELALFPGLAAIQDRLEEQGWLVRGQATFILQGHTGFRSPYQGGASMTPRATSECASATS